MFDFWFSLLGSFWPELTLKCVCRKFYRVISDPSLWQQLYVLGGDLSVDDPTKSVEQYFPEKNRWEEVGALCRQRHSHGAVGDPQRHVLYVFGGGSRAGARSIILSTTEAFTPHALQRKLRPERAEQRMP